MDMITLAMAKAYSDSKGGYSKPGKVLTFDGKPNPNDVVMDGMLVKISEKIYDFNSVERITVNVDGESVVYDKSEFVVEQGFGITGYVQDKGDFTFALSITDELSDSMGIEKGTYFLCDEDNNIYTAKVEFTETIVPIDPKFLPDTVATKADIFGAMEASY